MAKYQPKKNKRGRQGEGGGRPSKKDSLDLGMIETLYGFGLIDEQIAELLKIAPNTIKNWNEDEKFLAARKRGKAISDDRVERSLYERATGYSHLDTDIRVVEGKIVTTEIIKHYPPDTTACIFWLKNRKRAEWRDKQEIEHSASGSIMAAVAAHLSGEGKKEK